MIVVIASCAEHPGQRAPNEDSSDPALTSRFTSSGLSHKVPGTLAQKCPRATFAQMDCKMDSAFQGCPPDPLPHQGCRSCLLVSGAALADRIPKPDATNHICGARDIWPYGAWPVTDQRNEGGAEGPRVDRGSQICTS